MSRFRGGALPREIRILEELGMINPQPAPLTSGKSDASTKQTTP